MCIKLAYTDTHTVVVPFDDLQEQRGPVLHWLGEDLQQVAIVIKVHENMQLLQLQNQKENSVESNYRLLR